MIKVTYPDIDCEDVFITCLASVHPKGESNIDYLGRMRDISDEIYLSWRDFQSRIDNKEFYLISPCLPARTEQVIVGKVTKFELKQLYEDYMLKAGSESRKVYNKLRASAPGGICPLCGIRGVATLDHYLPKSRFPMHSVNPRNLIPACRDCNTGKTNSIFDSRFKQTFYAYDDNDIFYSEDWIFAIPKRIEDILVFDFYAKPPSDWSEENRERAISHFDGYNLRAVYVENSVREITEIKLNIKNILSKSGSSEEVREFYQMHARAQPKNSFKRAIFFAVIEDEDLCKGIF
ncbi:HNH endonuclease [Pantoea agglomerans]|uniref:HNH endonuclease n=1 Tax=Enterobacter agglomerans TaxID=549 RepID=UPI00177ED9B0|nr:HNH endonuclease [Pantoea agglomerans]MBD8156010.1 HNH endonuclease [Pantoea agglomerans]